MTTVERQRVNARGEVGIDAKGLRDWTNPLDKNSTSYFGSERDGGYAE